MKIEKLPSGNYRVRKTFNKRTHTRTFDHKPTQKEILEAFDGITVERPTIAHGSFDDFFKEYIRIKTNVIRADTIKGYIYTYKKFPQWFKDTPLKDLNNEKIQECMNQYAKTHAPKTVYNAYRVVTMVLTIYRPDYVPRGITMPQQTEKELYIPNADEVRAILNESIGSKYAIAIHLGCLGLRRSEIAALQLSDIDDDNVMHVHRAKIELLEGGTTIVDMTKTDESNRYIKLPDEFADAIRSQGYIYEGALNGITKYLRRLQVKLGIPKFRLHDLRHFFITEMFDAGIPEADILYLVGHSTDSITKRTYRHSRAKKDEVRQLNMTSIIEEKLS